MRKAPKTHTARLQMGHQNIHWPTARRNLPKVVKGLLERLETVPILGINEGGRMEDIAPQLIAAGYRVWWDKKQPGSMSTAVVWDPNVVEFVDAVAWPLTERFFMPAGAGPPWVQQKFVVVVTFRYQGRIIHFGCFHGIASLGVVARRKWAVKFFTRMADVARKDRYRDNLIYFTGDMNTKPGSRYARLLDAVLDSTQVIFGIKDTHRVGPIDDGYINHAPGRWMAVDRIIEDSWSDHHYYGIVVAIKPRVRR